MESPDFKRRTKNDKAKEKFQRNGGKTSRHVREVEALQEKRASQAKAK